MTPRSFIAIRTSSVIRFALLALLGTSASAGESTRLNYGPVQPANYVSSSGAYTLFIDPTDRHGYGAAAYRLSKNGLEVWSAEKPYTLRVVTVTDDGMVAGVAYRQSPRHEGNRRSPDRFMHIVILAADGHEILSEVRQRKDSPWTHGPTLPEMIQFMVDTENDRIIARVQARKSQWWVYRLSSGDLIGRFNPKDWIGDSPHPQYPVLERPHTQYVIDAQLVPSTPLTLVHWYTKGPDYEVKDAGALFVLVDPEVGVVWSFEAENDYAEVDFGYNSFGGGPSWYFEKHPAIASTAAGGRFDLRIFAENKQAAFAVRQTVLGTWSVTELGRLDVMEGKQRSPVEVQAPPKHLPYLGEIVLATSDVEDSPFHGFWDFTFDSSGNIYFLKNNKEEPATLLCSDLEGHILSQRSLHDPGEAPFRRKLTEVPRHNDDFYYLVSKSGDDRFSAWMVHLATGDKQPFDHYPGGYSKSFSRFADGGFVICEASSPFGLRSYDAAGQLLWEHPEGAWSLAVTSDQRIIVLDSSSMRLLSRDGTPIKTIDLRGAFGNTEFGGSPGYLHEVVADADGGFLVANHRNPPVVLRYHADGSLRSRWSPRHPDGKTFDLRPQIRVARDGRLWTGDGNSIMRLTDEGVVDLVLGTKPEANRLDGIAAFTVDRRGNLYAVARGTGAIHVFDQDGKPKRVIEPNPADVHGTVKESFIAVRDDGEVYVKKPRTTYLMPPDEYLRFSPSGEPLETITFEPSIPVGSFLSPGWAFQPKTGYRCGMCGIAGDERLVIVDPPGTLVREERRRPNGKWFGDRTNLAMAPDGSMVILDHDMFRADQAVYDLDLFSADGVPVRTVRLPPTEGRYTGIAFDGRRAIVAGLQQIVIVDMASGFVDRLALSESAVAEGGWAVFIARGGEELLLFDHRGGRLHRYQLPKQVGRADPKATGDSEPRSPDPTDALVQSPWVQQYMEIMATLPAPRPCVAYIQKIDRGETVLTEAQALELPEDERRALRMMNLDDCGIRFDQPRMYGRMLDIMALAGLDDPANMRILAVGCCDLRSLQTVARLGVDVVGALAGSSLTAMCNDWDDVGALVGPDGQTGQLEVLRGHELQPGGLEATKATGYDAITIRNVLQDPEPEDYFSSDKWVWIGLGRDKEHVATVMHDLLRPGGLLLVYNIAIDPAPTESAIPRSLWEAAGFEIVAFDQDDRGAAIRIGEELGWAGQSGPLGKNIRAKYSLLRRPLEP